MIGIGILGYALIFHLYLENIYSFMGHKQLLFWISNSFAIVTFVFSLFMFIFFAFLTYSIFYLNLPKKKDYDFIIIHGSGLIDGEKVPPLLASRIEKAMEAYRMADKADVKLIASGGQGSDVKISEAQKRFIVTCWNEVFPKNISY